MIRFGCVVTFAFAVVGVLVFGGPAVAADGVIEISQTTAIAGGTTLGDGPGFPITLSQRGAYRLTSNLTLPDQNAIGIDVTIDGVSIDLNGFAIVGPVVCSGVPVTSCLPAGVATGIGIRGPDHVSVRNGTIRGTGAQAIVLTWNARIEKVDVQMVAPSGLAGAISVGDQSTISETSATSNFGTGIFAARYAIIKSSTSTGNTGYGILAQTGTLISGCTASINGTYGLGVYGLGSVAYIEGTLNYNALAAVNGSVVNLGHNLCNPSPCP